MIVTVTDLDRNVITFRLSAVLVVVVPPAFGFVGDGKARIYLPGAVAAVTNAQAQRVIDLIANEAGAIAATTL